MPSYSWNPGYSAADSEPLRRRAVDRVSLHHLRQPGVWLYPYGKGSGGTNTRADLYVVGDASPAVRADSAGPGGFHFHDKRTGFPKRAFFFRGLGNSRYRDQYSGFHRGPTGAADCVFVIRPQHFCCDKDVANSQ